MPSTEPGFRPVVSRRRVLAGGAALAVLGMAVPACSSPPAPPAVDELESQLTLARRDSELAAAAAAAAEKPVSAALTEVAAERAQHAQALTTEIARLAVNPTSTSSETTSPTTTSFGRRGSPTVAGRRGQVLAGVRGQRQSAGEHVFGLSGRAARLHRRSLHGVLHGRAGVRSTRVVTSAEPSSAATPSRQRAVRCADHRTRRHLRLRHGVRPLPARREQPGVFRAESAPPASRPGHRDAGRPLGQRSGCRRGLPTADADQQRQPMRCAWPCEWRRTPRWPGVRSSSRLRARKTASSA